MVSEFARWDMHCRFAFGRRKILRLYRVELVSLIAWWLTHPATTQARRAPLPGGEPKKLRRSVFEIHYSIFPFPFLYSADLHSVGAKYCASTGLNWYRSLHGGYLADGPQAGDACGSDGKYSFFPFFKGIRCCAFLTGYLVAALASI